MKKTLKIGALTVIALLLLSVISIKLYYRFPDGIIPAKGEVFVGTITGENINCTLPDGGESLVIGDKNVETSPGYIENVSNIRFGEKDSKLWVCNNFDYSKIKRDSIGIPLESEPNGGEELIGIKVEVYAKRIDENSYTLRGNENFYVKVID